MSLKSAILHVLGTVTGILIPGASEKTVNLTTAVQQELADAMGQAATDLAERLKTDTTGMSGPDKVFAITRALVAAAQAQGFKGDLKVLGAVALDVAQAAYRKAEPEIEAGIVALATAFHATPLVMIGVEVLAQLVQAEADKLLPAAAAPAAA